MNLGELLKAVASESVNMDTVIHVRVGDETMELEELVMGEDTEDGSDIIILSAGEQSDD